MSFRGRYFRPRARGFTRPPRGDRGGPPVVRGNFRLPLPKPQPYVVHSTASSQDDYRVSEPAVFEARDKFHRTRSPDEEVHIVFVVFKTKWMV